MVFQQPPGGEFPPKVPAGEKLLPFPQPVGVSYGYVCVGIGARERQSWKLRAGGDEFNSDTGGCWTIGPRNLQAAARAWRAYRGNFGDPDYARALRPCCRLAAAGHKTERACLPDGADPSCLEPGGARRRGRDSRTAEIGTFFRRARLSHSFQ